jgi:hypothetical protein
MNGQSVLLRTYNGVGEFALMSGTVAGSVLLEVTDDRLDNNVGNGITDPIYTLAVVSIVDSIPVDEPDVADLEITTTELDDGVVGQFYAQILEATGGTPPYTWAVTFGDPPPGLDLDASGVIHGTPTTAGTYNLVIAVTDSASRTTQVQLSIVITEMGDETPALSITTTSLPDGIEGEFYVHDLAATGGIPPYTWEILGGLPASLELPDPATGRISGTPDPGTARPNDPYLVGVQVTDSAGTVVAKMLNLTIDLPVLKVVDEDVPVACQNQFYVYQLIAEGGTPPYVWTDLDASFTQTGGLSLSADGLISGTPTAATSTDPYLLAVQVEDAVGDTAVTMLPLTISSCMP